MTAPVIARFFSDGSGYLLVRVCLSRMLRSLFAELDCICAEQGL
jgi:hypothetical protein